MKALIEITCGAPHLMAKALEDRAWLCDVTISIRNRRCLSRRLTAYAEGEETKLKEFLESSKLFHDSNLTGDREFSALTPDS
jgi:hypothetical protein